MPKISKSTELKLYQASAIFNIVAIASGVYTIKLLEKKYRRLFNLAKLNSKIISRFAELTELADPQILDQIKAEFDFDRLTLNFFDN